MQRFLIVVLFFGLISQAAFAQEISTKQNITPGTQEGEYNITTTITYLEGVDIASITYSIPKELYKPSTNNHLFSNIEDEFIKFYIMSIPSDGILNIDLMVQLKEAGQFEFPVEFQYSKDEEKKVLALDPIIVNNGGEVIAVVEEQTTEETVPIDKETNNEVEKEKKKKQTEAEKLKEIAAAEELKKKRNLPRSKKRR